MASHSRRWTRLGCVAASGLLAAFLLRPPSAEAAVQGSRTLTRGSLQAHRAGYSLTLEVVVPGQDTVRVSRSVSLVRQ
jgi:hypothetical protein